MLATQRFSVAEGECAVPKPSEPAVFKAKQFLWRGALRDGDEVATKQNLKRLSDVSLASTDVPNDESPSEAIGAEVTSCATDMAIKLQDLLKLSVTFDNLELPNVISTQASTNCHLLHRGRPAESEIEPYLLTAQQMKDVVRDSVYHITFSNAYTQDPYFISPTAEPQRQEKFGWWSEINFGATMWGMQCQPGSVVAAHERVRSAHCINVNARVGEDVIIKDKLPASALRETGHAVGGWFNLQGAKKVYRQGVGPGPSQEEQVSLRLNCRYVPGLSRLCETKDGNCDQDEIVTGLEFENATFMKYRCCKMPRTFGQTFVPGGLGRHQGVGRLLLP